MVRTFQITKALAAMPVIDNMLLAAPDQPGEHLPTLLTARPRGAGARRRSTSTRIELLATSTWTKLPTTTPARSPAASASCSSSRGR